MQSLREICQQYKKWKPLEEAILRIDTYRGSDGAIVLESCKSLVESICRTILEDLNEPASTTESLQSLVSKACNKMICLPRTSNLARSFSTVAQRLAEFRNDFAVIAHGASVYQIEKRRNIITKATTDFMIATVEQLAVFLITIYEVEYPTAVPQILRYEDNFLFNTEFDNQNELIQIGEYGPYSPSEVLFHVDSNAYKTELSNSPWNIP